MINKTEIKFDNLSNNIIGMAIEVHKTLGPGYLEALYHNAMKIELTLNNIIYDTERIVKMWYKSREIGFHKIDLLIENKLIIELKTVTEISDIHIAQLLSYLKETNIETGLILNFSKPKLEIRRVSLKKPMNF